MDFEKLSRRDFLKRTTVLAAGTIILSGLTKADVIQQGSYTVSSACMNYEQHPHKLFWYTTDGGTDVCYREYQCPTSGGFGIPEYCQFIFENNLESVLPGGWQRACSTHTGESGNECMDMGIPLKAPNQSWPPEP